jgi:hypothetical protein
MNFDLDFILKAVVLLALSLAGGWFCLLVFLAGLRLSEYVLPKDVYNRYAASMFNPLRGVIGGYWLPDEHEKEVARLRRVAEKYGDTQPADGKDEKKADTFLLI